MASIIKLTSETTSIRNQELPNRIPEKSFTIKITGPKRPNRQNFMPFGAL